jgi:hypothetical protein
MSDQRNFGPAKFWAMTAEAAGVDLADSSAMQRFTLDVQNGRIEYDEDVLDPSCGAVAGATVRLSGGCPSSRWPCRPTKSSPTTRRRVTSYSN